MNTDKTTKKRGGGWWGGGSWAVEDTTLFLNVKNVCALIVNKNGNYISGLSTNFFSCVFGRRKYNLDSIPDREGILQEKSPANEKREIYQLKDFLVCINFLLVISTTACFGHWRHSSECCL